MSGWAGWWIMWGLFFVGAAIDHGLVEIAKATALRR